MKKIFMIIPIIFSMFCTNSYASCTPGDIKCETTRDDTMRLCIGDEVSVKCDGSLMDLCEVKCEKYYNDFQKCITIGPKTDSKSFKCINLGNYCDQGNMYIYDTKTKKTYKPMKENDSCQKTGTEIAKCKYNRNYGQDVLSCTAEKCKEPAYRLWFHNGNSMGTCYTEKDAQSYCSNPKYCEEKNCDPTYEDNKTHYGRKIKAFVGCHKRIEPRDTENIPHLTTVPTEPQPNPIAKIPDAPVPPIPDDNPQPEPKFSATAYCTSGTCRPADTDMIFADIDSDLEYYFASGSSSVWKNDNGKFNTARLASDSIAGVVLGTVGGVVTSKVIKKNQIKNGFEDLKCTIGGQNVATYGDEFNVGIK